MQFSKNALTADIENYDLYAEILAAISNAEALGFAETRSALIAVLKSMGKSLPKKMSDAS